MKMLESASRDKFIIKGAEEDAVGINKEAIQF